jgi:hypothetical protein
VLEAPPLGEDTEVGSELAVELLVEVLALVPVELLVELLLLTIEKAPLFTYQGELSSGKSEPDAC